MKCNVRHSCLLPILVGCWGVLLFASCEGLEVGSPGNNGQDNHSSSAFLSIDQQSVNLSDEGGVLEFLIRTNCSVSINVESGSEWLKYLSSASDGEFVRKLSFEYTPNESYDSRRAYVSVSSPESNLSAGFTVLQKQKDAITLAQSIYEVEEDGGTVSIEVKSNIEFVAHVSESAAGWLQIVSTKGLDSHSLLVDVSPNEFEDSRSGQVIISGAGKEEAITIYQQGSVPTLVLGQTRFDLSAEGCTITIPVTTNVEFEVIVPDVDWITYRDTYTKAMVSGESLFEIDSNTSYDGRTAEILFQSLDGLLTQTVLISQAAMGAIVLGSGRYELDADGGQITIPVQSNVDYSVLIPEHITWVTLLPDTKSLTESSFTLQVSVNEDPTNRNATIYIEGEGVNNSILIVQLGQSVLSLEGETNIEAGAEGLEFSLTVTSNLAYDIVIEEGVDWITRITDSDTKAITSNTISFRVAPNETDYNRQTDIRLLCDGYVYETIHVTQAGKTRKATIHIETPGTLSSKMSYDELRVVDELTLTGHVNKDDLSLFIGKQRHSPWGDGYFDPYKGGWVSTVGGDDWDLRVLDMSGLTIEEKMIPDPYFRGFDKLEKVALPEGIIFLSGFADCPQLSTVDFGTHSQLVVLGSSIRVDRVLGLISIFGAFAWCDNLKTITLPASLQKIEGGALYQSGIEEVVFSDHSAMTLIDGTTVDTTSGLNIGLGRESQYTFGVFYGCEKLKGVQLPNTIQAIGERGFSGWIGLEHIELPGSVQSIGKSAFDGCGNLQTIVLNESLAALGASAFNGCASLKQIVLPESVEYLGSNLFSGCSALEYVSVGPSHHQVYDNLFQGCEALKKVDFKGSISKVGVRAFSGCVSLETAPFMETVTELGAYAFEGCAKLSSVNLEKTLSIGEGALKGTGITFIKFPDWMESIPKGFLSECKQLQTVDFNHVNTIDEEAFSGTESLTDLTISNPVTGIRGYAFADSGLKRIVVRSDSLIISRSAFSDTSLESLVVGNTNEVLVGDVVSYGYNGGTFYKPIFDPDFSGISFEAGSRCRKFGICTGLKITGLDIPDSVTELGEYAFAECKNLSDAAATKIMGGNVKKLGTGAFLNTGLVNLVVPDNIKYIGDHAFSGSSIVTYQLPMTLEYLGDYTFASCDKLTKARINCENIKVGVGVFQNCSLINTIYFGPDIKSIAFGRAESNNSASHRIKRVVFEEGFNPDSMGGSIGCFSIEEVVFSSTMHEICPSMFSPNGIKYLSIPGNIKTIGDRAFSGLDHPLEIHLEEGLESIGGGAFIGEGALDWVVPSTVKAIGPKAFSGQGGTLTFQSDIPDMEDGLGFVGEVFIADDVTSIGNNAFRSMKLLTEITLPSSLESIGEGSFAYSGIQEIVIPQRVVTLKKDTFRYCDQLRTIQLPSSLNSVEDEAFLGCKNLSDIDISHLTTIGASAFKGCVSAFHDLDLSNLEQIGRSAFGSVHLESLSVRGDLQASGPAFDGGIGVLTVLGNPQENFYKSVIGSSSTSLVTTFILAEGAQNISTGFTGSRTKAGEYDTEVWLPSSVSHISMGAVYCTNLYVKATVPPEVETKSRVKGINVTGTVFVPGDSLQAYLDAWGSLVPDIQAYDFQVQ